MLYYELATDYASDAVLQLKVIVACHSVQHAHIPRSMDNTHLTIA